MDWSHLKVVLAIHQGGSLTAAAHILKTDQTTVGRRLTALEADLGGPLFVRAKSGFLPTDAGFRTIARARRVEAEVEALSEDLADPEDGARGVVRVCANTWMLSRLAGHALPELLSRNPDLDVRLSGRLPPTPLHGETTVSLWFDAAARPPDRATPFATVPYLICRRADVADDTPNWVQFQDDDAQGPSFGREIRKRLGPDAKVIATATDALILKSAIAAGLGRGHLPACLVNDDALATAPGLDRVLHLHVNPELARTRRVVVVTEWLRTAGLTALAATPLPEARRTGR